MTIPNINDTRPRAFVSDNATALRLHSDAVFTLAALNTERPDAVTLQCWFRPELARRGVRLFAKPDFTGFSRVMKAGLHRDLSTYPMSADGIGSIRIPPGWQVVLFDAPDCKGCAIHLDTNSTDRPDIDGARAKSMLVISPSDLAQDHCVLFEAPKDGRAHAHMLRAGRHALPQTPNIAHVVLPPATRLKLCQNPDFQGDVTVFEKSETAPLIPASAAVISKPHALRDAHAKVSKDLLGKEPEQAFFLFGDQNGAGLWLSATPANGVFEQMRLSFGGKRLREEKWVHLASTFDGAKRNNFVDGRLVSTQADKTIPNTYNEEWLFVMEARDLFQIEASLSTCCVFKGAFDAARLAKTRHVLPDADTEDLIECWPLNASGDDPIIGLCGGKASEDAATWQGADLPKSILQGGTTHQAVVAVHEVFSKRAKTAEQRAGNRINLLQSRNAREVGEAAEKAKAHAYTSGIKGIYALNGKGIHTLSTSRYGLEKYDWNIRSYVNGGIDDTVAFTHDRTGGTCFWAALTGFEDAGAGAKKYTIMHGGNTVDDTPGYNYENDNAILSLETPILGMVFDKSGSDLNSMLYWIDDKAMIYSIEIKAPYFEAVGAPALRAQLPARPASAYSLAIDERKKNLFVANGHDIWICHVTNDPRDQRSDNCDIFINHAVSPNPIAVTVDEGTGSVFWLDGQLECVFCCDKNGENVRKLYAAPKPRPGITLDYVDLKGVADEAKGDNDTTQKRIYWTSLPDTKVSATVVFDPGPFVELSTAEPTNRWQAAMRDPLEQVSTAIVDFIPDWPVIGKAEDRPQAMWTDEDGVPWRHNFRDMEVEFHTEAEEGDGHKYWTSSWSEHHMVVYVTNLSTGETFDLPDQPLREGNFFPAANQPSGRYLMKHGGKIAIHTSSLLNPSVADSTEPVYLEARPKTPDQQFSDEQHFEWLKFAQFSASGASVLTDWNNKKGVLMLWNAATGKWIGECRVDKGQKIARRMMATYAGKDALFLFGTGGTLRVIDMENGQSLGTYAIPKNPRIGPAMLFPQGDRLVFDGHGGFHLLDLSKGNVIRSFAADFYYNSVESFHLLKDATHMLVVYSNHIVLWDIETGKQLQIHAFDQKARFLGLGEHEDVVYMAKDGDLMEIPLDRQPSAKVVNFRRGSHVNFEAFLLDCSQGFSAQLHIRPICPHVDRTNYIGSLESILFKLGAPGEGQIEMKIDKDRHLVLTVTHAQGQQQTLIHDAEPIKDEVWSTIGVSISALGWGVITLNGSDTMAQGQIACPETGLRSSGFISISAAEYENIEHRRDDPPFPFEGQISLLRLWNRELADKEIAAFHKVPATPVTYDGIHRETALFDTPNRTCQLMTGSNDGTSPPVALHDFSTDGGLSIHSEVGDAHAHLITAEHHRIDAVVVAAKRKAAAHAEAIENMNAAHAEHEKALRKAKKTESDARNWAANYLAPAQAKLDKAKAEKAVKVGQANDQSWHDVEKARAARNAKTEQAYAQYDAAVTPARKRLSDAQTKRDASGFAEDGSALKEHKSEDD